MLKATPRVSSRTRSAARVPTSGRSRSLGIRSLILVAVTVVLILIVLPAALVAAGS